MALSRVWSYLILFSIAVAGYQYLRGDSNIFNDLVTEHKLADGESWPETGYQPADAEPPTTAGLDALAPALARYRWVLRADPASCRYAVTAGDPDAARSRLEKKLETLPLLNPAAGVPESGRFPAGSRYVVLGDDPGRTIDSLTAGRGLVRAAGVFSADIVFTAAPADSLRRVFLASLARMRLVAVDDVPFFFPKNIDGIFETGKFAIVIVIGLIGTLALFMGLLQIAEKAGGIQVLSRLISPFLSRLFPGVPRNHPSFGHMVMNFSANLLGLDNAATPFGLKAMQSLQEINPDKDRATNAQIMFLALHASGLTLIPVSIIAVRAANGSLNPNEIFIPLMLSTFVCTLTAMLATSLKQRINIFQPGIFFPVFSVAAFLGLFVWFLTALKPYALDVFSDAFSNGAILLVFLVIIAGGLYKRINLFEAFVEGAKGGFETAVRIIPYLVGMLVAVSMLRTSGAFDLVIAPVKSFIAWAGMDTRFAEGLPTAFLRPFSAGGARGFMIDAMRTYGPDSFIGKLVCVLQGSSETTFYVVALYFGSVSVKDTRYAIPVMLLADFAGVVFSIAFAYFLWG